MSRTLLILAICGFALLAEDDPNRQLLKAADKGDVDKIAALSKQGVSVTIRDTESKTPVYYAARSGHLVAAQMLIDLGAPVDAPDEKGVTPLMTAAEEGHLELIRLLIARGANVNAVSTSKQTALTFASLKRDYDAVRVLVEAGATAEGSQVFIHPDYLSRKPSTVALLIEDARPEKPRAGEYRENLGKTVNHYLEHKKYSTTKEPEARQKLVSSGMAPDAVDAVPIAESCKALGTEALLKTRLNRYGTAELVIKKKQEMDLDFFLHDCKSGELLWKLQTGPAWQELGFLVARMKRVQFDLVVGEAMQALPKRDEKPKKQVAGGKGVTGKVRGLIRNPF